MGEIEVSVGPYGDLELYPPPMELDGFVTADEDENGSSHSEGSFHSLPWARDLAEAETDSGHTDATATPLSTSPPEEGRVSWCRTLVTYWRNQRVACVWLLLYAGANAAVFSYKAHHYATSPDHETTRHVFGNCVVVARGAALSINLNALLILLPLCRHFWTWVQTSPPPQCRTMSSSSEKKQIKRLHWTSWLPLDQWTLIHRVIGVVFLCWVVVHCTAHACDFYRFAHHPDPEDLMLLFPHEDSVPSDPAGRWRFLLRQPAAITGIVMVACILVAGPCIVFRQRLGYDLFWWSHHLLLIMLFTLMFHGIGRILEPPESMYWVGGPLLVYSAQRLWREVADLFCPRARSQVLLLTVKPGKVVALRMTKPPAWEHRLRAGMYANLKIPAISMVQWHPFTISSAPSDDFIEFHIRTVGDWTDALYNLAKSFARQQPASGSSDPVGMSRIDLVYPPPAHGPEGSRAKLTSERWLWDKGPSVLNPQFSQELSSDTTVTASADDPPGLTPQDLIVQVDGPLGAPSQGYSHHRMVVLVGAGIGITPMISILKELLANPGKMQRTYLVWTFREQRALDWFSSLINDILTRSSSSVCRRQFLQLRFFVTAAQNHDMAMDRRKDMSSKVTVQYGRRPDWQEELTHIYQDVRSFHCNKCGIFVCGPTAMANQIRKTSFRISQRDTRFHFYIRREKFSG